MTLPVAYRAPRENDFAFIIASWLRSNRTAPAHAAMWDEAYFRTYQPVVAKLVRSSHLMVAVDPEDADHVYGFVAWSPEPFALHYVYIKRGMRHYGLAKAMLAKVRPSFGDAVTVVTAACRPEASSAPRWPDLVKRWRLSYEPYVALRS